MDPLSGVHNTKYVPLKIRIYTHSNTKRYKTVKKSNATNKKKITAKLPNQSHYFNINYGKSSKDAFKSVM